MLSLIEFPAPTQFFASTSEWAKPMFNELWSVVYIPLGIFIGASLLLLVVIFTIWVFSKMINMFHH